MQFQQRRGDEKLDRELALRRAVAVMRYMRDYAFKDYSEMNAVGYGSNKFLDNEDVTKALNLRKQYLCFYFYQ